MKYLLLIHQGDAPRPHREGDGNTAAVAAWDSLPDEEKQAIYADYMAINQTPGVTPGQELQPAEVAKTVRVKNRQTLVHDGPFAETKEAIAGYLLFEADDMAAAIELASRIPVARLGGAIEVREVVER
jgi:hypothetical protein